MACVATRRAHAGSGQKGELLVYYKRDGAVFQCATTNVQHPICKGTREPSGISAAIDVRDGAFRLLARNY